MGTLGRYTLKEMLRPALAWLGFLYLLLLVMAFLRGTEVLLGSSVTLGDLLRFTALMTPHFLMQAAPVAFLLGLLLGFGRLADDGELKAMQGLGLAPARLLFGPLGLAVGVAAAMAVLCFTLQPWGLRGVREMANEIIKRNVAANVKPGVFDEEVADFTLYTEQVTKDGWRNVLVYDGRDPAAPMLVLAREGKAAPSSEGGGLELRLGGGALHQVKGPEGGYALAQFEQASLQLDVGNNLFRQNRFATVREEQTPLELLEAARQPEAPNGGVPFRVAFHWRLGQALEPLAFACIGLPLSLMRRGGRARGLALTLVAYLGYYLLARVGMGLGERSLLPALVAGQLSNLIFVALGLLGLWRLSSRGVA